MKFYEFWNVICKMLNVTCLGPDIAKLCEVETSMSVVKPVNILMVDFEYVMK